MIKTELEWYSVEEKLPQDREFVFVCYRIDNNIWYDFLWYNKEDKVFEHTDFNVELKDVIAWSELPKEGEYYGERNS